MSTSPASEGFDPYQLMSDASVNRTTLAALEGADQRLVGQRAFDLLSLGPLKQLCLEHGFADDPHVLESVAFALSGACKDSAETERARTVCREYGRRLAHLIASLVTPGASIPWSAWRGEYLEYWSRVDQVWLGGGVAAAFDAELRHAVRGAMSQLGGRQCQIDIAPHPGSLAVIGCARSRRDPAANAIALDFGHSTVKRGVAIIRDGSLEELELLPPRTVPAPEPPPTPELARSFVLDTIADTYRIAQHHHARIDPRLAVSLATYLVDGMPVDAYSLYRPLGAVTMEWLERELERRIGAVVRLTFLHDGTAAARALPNGGRAAVIMLGTSLGVGFSPAATADLLPISTRFTVH